jgi:hypothetical protein
MGIVPTDQWLALKTSRTTPSGPQCDKLVRVNFAHVRAMWIDPDGNTVLRFGKNDELYVVEEPPEIIQRLASRESKSLGF